MKNQEDQLKYRPWAFLFNRILKFLRDKMSFFFKIKIPTLIERFKRAGLYYYMLVIPTFKSARIRRIMSL